ncbi:ATP-binding cassette domain-containing protein [Amycolatopsis sp. NPDC023774]|uniref:ATP-binding cassette domain-containing protein n=1 Tax=Amycolatopsis sp. NPDC023774 TaxID=3155015 RepID=UPI0033E902AC
MPGLTKRFPGRTVAANAVDGIDLEIAEGKLVTLLGPSGCGKTTTLRLIAGLERADAGSIELDGKVVSDPRNRVFAGAHRRPIGIVSSRTRSGRTCRWCRT